jgi:YegS/Rv2252/BmrU family lipid kinase
MAAHTVVIVNPQAGGGSLGRRWVEVAETLRRTLGSFDDARTEGPGDATRIAAEAVAGGADTVVAIGGDGTINEVVNGFFDSDGAPLGEPGRCALGIIPFGTGGDFRKTTRLPKDLESAAAVISDRRIQTIDAGRLSYTPHDAGDGVTETRMFANIASFGLSGLVDEMVNQSSKRLGGRLSFMLATARAGLRYENQRVSLRFDDHPEAVDMTISTVAVANGRYFGGGMKVAPDAELDDGYFDVVAIGDMSTMDFVLHGHKLYRGTHLGHPKISCRRAKSVSAEPLGGGDPVRLDVDGETPGRLPARFDMVASALALIVP